MSDAVGHAEGAGGAGRSSPWTLASRGLYRTRIPLVGLGQECGGDPQVGGSEAGPNETEGARVRDPRGVGGLGQPEAAEPGFWTTPGRDAGSGTMAGVSDSGPLGSGPETAAKRGPEPDRPPNLRRRGEGEGHLSRARSRGRSSGGLGVGAGLACERTQARTAEQRGGQHGDGGRGTPAERGQLEDEEDDARGPLGRGVPAKAHARTTTPSEPRTRMMHCAPRAACWGL